MCVRTCLELKMSPQPADRSSPPCELLKCLRISARLHLSYPAFTKLPKISHFISYADPTMHENSDGQSHDADGLTVTGFMAINL